LLFYSPAQNARFWRFLKPFFIVDNEGGAFTVTSNRQPDLRGVRFLFCARYLRLLLLILADRTDKPNQRTTLFL
jgi:hypothetical protein